MSKQKSTSVADIIINNRLVVKRPAVSEMGTPGEVVWVDPATLHIDHNSYQRDTNPKHAMKIGSQYRYDRAKVISGYKCPTSGIIYVTDGQHSSIGAALAGVPKVPVYLFPLPSESSEQELIKLQSAQFVAINKNQKKIQKYDEYRNDLIQGDPNALGIDRICRKHGVTIIPTTRAKGVATVSHVVNVVKAYTQIGESGLDLAFGFIRKHWPSDHIEGSVIISLARFLKKFEEAKSRKIDGTEYNDRILYDAITLGGIRSQKEVESLLGDIAVEARIPTTGDTATWRARAIRQAYNDWVSNHKLGDDKLLNRKVIG